MANNISISNNNIANYVMFILNKLDNDFTNEELEQIKEITVNCEEEIGNVFDLRELLKLKNLEKISIRNGYLYNIDFQILSELKKLESLYFEKCEFEDATLIGNIKLKSLSLISCSINDFSFVSILTDLKELSIVGGNINVDQIALLSKIEYLQLSYSNIIGNIALLNLQDLKELHIDNTDIENLSFVNNLYNLRKLSIDESQYQKDKSLVSQLKNKGVNIYNENIVGIGSDKSEL
jgi:hypothetical protein